MLRYPFLIVLACSFLGFLPQSDARTAFYATVYAASSADPDGVIAISDTGVITPFAISSDFGQPQGLALDSGGNIFFTEDENIWKVTPLGVRTLFASGAVTASFYGLAIDAANNVYVSDWGSSDILKFNAAGAQQSFVTGGVFANGLAIGPGGYLYSAEQGEIGVFDSVGTRTTYYQFTGPYDSYLSTGLAFNQAGELFVSGLGELDAVIKVTGNDPLNPMITTVVSSGVGDLHGISFDPNGKLFLANWTCGCGTNENGILFKSLSGSADPSLFAGTGVLSPNFIIALPVPEPSSALLLAIGLGALGLLKARKTV